MVIFALNTATDTTEMAIVDGEKTLFRKEWSSARNEAEKIFPALQAALKKAGSKKEGSKKIEKIFVVEGPGSFTSLRIGVTVANALAGYFHVPLISCNTFEYLRMRLPVERKKDTAVILKGGGDHVALALPGSKKIHRMSVEELEPFLKRKKTVKYGTGEKSLMIKGMKQVANKKMRSLGEVVLELPKKAPSKKLVKPYYLNPPHITKSKKEVFA